MLIVAEFNRVPSIVFSLYRVGWSFSRWVGRRVWRVLTENHKLICCQLLNSKSFAFYVEVHVLKVAAYVLRQFSVGQSLYTLWSLVKRYIVKGASAARLLRSFLPILM